MSSPAPSPVTAGSACARELAATVNMLVAACGDHTPVVSPVDGAATWAAQTLRVPMPDGDVLTLSLRTDLSYGVPVGSVRIGVYNQEHAATVAETSRTSMYTTDLHTLVLAWAAHPERVDRYWALSEWAQGVQHFTASNLFRRNVATTYRSDGRFAVKGVIEPYPGAWPTKAVVDWVIRDDLSALWPYLGTESEETP